MIQEDDKSKLLEEATPWDKLLPSDQAYFGTPAQYQQRILDKFHDHQKPYEQTLNFIPPQQYYDALIQYGIGHFLVFPYHLITQLQQYVPMTPFVYYTTMLLRVMQSDHSYQSIPNFAAADALRITGVGRNQFIDAMIASRSGGIGSILKSKEKILRSLLPLVPVKFNIQPWWILRRVPAPEQRIAKLTQSQRLTYERIAASEPQGTEIGRLSEDDIRVLINENLLYIVVPLSAPDTVRILPLNNFVMNRVGGDYLESLCYNSFISIDESTTVEQLAKMLAVDVTEVAKVLSLFVRLGVAEKVTVEDHQEVDQVDSKRLVAIYDTNLPSAFMLGNLGPSVMEFAVTLYETGKLPSSRVESLILALKDVQPPFDESMVASHQKCQVIARTCEFLRAQPLANGSLDLLKLDSLLKLDNESRNKMFERNYVAAIVILPLTLQFPSLSIPGLVHFGPPSPLFHSPWAMLYMHHVAKGGPPVFVWPQGEIVTSLPAPFFEYDTVRLFKWDADALVVSTTTLLISLNDALPSSPVLVQCYEKEGQTISNVAFPEAEVDPELSEAFCLDSLFGAIEFANSDGKQWPLDIQYGIPTNSLHLCNSVIGQIEQKQMLGEDNIGKMQKSTEICTKNLEEFVKQWSCGIGHPVRSIFASEGTIKWI